MKYIDAYNKIINILQGIEGIRRSLSMFYSVTYDSEKPVRSLIEENSELYNVNNIIEFVDELHEFGVISNKDLMEFRDYGNLQSRKINKFIFAAGEKIDITWDVTYNEIEVEKDDNKYLIYELDSYNTITWRDLCEYFKEYNTNLNPSGLCNRILKFSTDIEIRFYNTYINYIYNLYRNMYGDQHINDNFNIGNYPNLLPQYALKNRMKTIIEDGGTRKVIHRIDFALILNNKVILIEIDGKEHYSIRKETCYSTYYNCDFDRISNERRIDRELNLQGYEIYRFLNQDIENKDDGQLVEYLTYFFNDLFKKHNIKID